jgi:naphthalene 1,2-dioxygenase ferredoxin reductase component
MSKSSYCTLTVNGQKIRAHVGDNLVDAALGGRVVVPHDCCSGQCDTCRVTVLSGDVDDQGTGERDTVLGCQATIEGDAEIVFDPVPVVRRVTGIVSDIAPLGEGIVEVRVRLRKPLSWLPGQYVRVTFAGFPARDYSPTFGLNGDAEEDLLIFQIRLYENGTVSSAIGSTINIGHKVSVRGPYGHAFLRRGEGRLVLLSTGTGFAPIWTIALAARLGQPHRPIIVVAGARQTLGLYFHPAVTWMRERGIEVALTAGDGDGVAIRRERPAALLPQLQASDTVYVAGAPSLVDAVKAKALASEAMCYADPFLPSGQSASLRTRLARLWRPRPVTAEGTGASAAL